jgi:hypothetical protein
MTPTQTNHPTLRVKVFERPIGSEEWAFGCQRQNQKLRKGDLQKQVGSNAKSMKTCEGDGALTKEQGGPFCSLTFLYLSVKIVSNVESSKERTCPRLGSDPAI